MRIRRRTRPALRRRACSGLWKALHERLRVWTKGGIWEQILAYVIVKDDSIWTLWWTFSVGSTATGLWSPPVTFEKSQSQAREASRHAAGLVRVVAWRWCTGGSRSHLLDRCADVAQAAGDDELTIIGQRYPAVHIVPPVQHVR